MSGDTSDPRSKLPEPESEMLLPRSTRSALVRELSPSRADRDRVRAGIAGAVAGAAASTLVGHAEAAMAARAAELKTGGAIAGKTLATKLIVSSVVIATAGAVVTGGVLLQAGRQRGSALPAARVQVPQPMAAAAEAQAARAETPSAAPIQQPGVVEAAPVPSPSHALPRSRTPRTRPSSRVNPSAAAQPSASNGAPVPAAVAASTEPTEPAAPPPPQPTAAKPAAAPDTLADELALVRSAADALNRRNAAGALSLLARYEHSHPNGSLATEARALRVMALCAAKRPDAASARDAFLRAHASSALAERVRSACP